MSYAHLKIHAKKGLCVDKSQYSKKKKMSELFVINETKR